MEVVVGEVDDDVACLVADPCAADVPLLGIVQSKTGVPVGTSWRVSSICRDSTSSVCRTPSPVMLRQIG